MREQLDDVVANVRTFGAGTSGRGSDLHAIQRAIDEVAGVFEARPVHVLFPAGDYAIDGPLYFRHAWQHTTFLAGARLVLTRVEACVVIQAPNQVIEHLTVVGEGRRASTPAVQIQGASRLLLDGCDVSVSGAAAIAVRIWALTGVTVEGGRIYSLGDAAGVRPPARPGSPLARIHSVGGAAGIGVQLYQTVGPGDGIDGDGAFEPVLQGVSIEGFEQGIQVACTSESVGVFDCDLRENDVDIVLKVAAEGVGPVGVTSLAIANCRFGGTGTARIRLAAGASILGGEITGCLFQAPSAEGSVIFDVGGSVNGMVVSGCTVFDEDGAAGAVWNLEGAASVSEIGDLFNAWQGLAVRGGLDTTLRFSVMSGDDDGELTTSHRGTGFDAGRLGFLGVTPAAKGDRYTPIFGGSVEAFDCDAEAPRDLLNTLTDQLSGRGIVQQWPGVPGPSRR